MEHTKRTTKKKARQRGKRLLTKSDLTKIRQNLPKDWRNKIAETRYGLTLRQITEVFNQRTKNSAANVSVWTSINEVLRSAKQYVLVEKVEKVISFYNSLDNVSHK